MAKTEITKILFRRGEEKHRRSLYPYGGLDNGEPGWTSVSEKESSALSAYGLNPHFPDLSDTVYASTSGLPAKRSALGFEAAGGTGSIPKGMCDLWIGGGISEEDDIYIGGQSAEYYNQMRFVSLSGTDLNHPLPYVQGNFTIGAVGSTYAFQHYGTANFDGDVTIGASGVGDQLRVYSDNGDLTWNKTYGVLQFNTDTAIKLPCGVTNERPNTAGDNEDYTGVGLTTGLTGMMRFNTENTSFEGHNGTDWVGVGGAMSIDRKTYISFEDPISNTTDCSSMAGTDHTITFVTNCSTAGTFDESGNLEVTNNIYAGSDIVAFYSSDERLKDNISVIDNPLEKIDDIRGVEFDWNSSGPDWVDEEHPHDVGLIAQDIERVIPEAVITRDDGYKAVDYKRVIPLLVESVKELTARVEHLESK